MTTTRSLVSPLTIRTPEDLIAVASSIMGFTPEHSMVMLTFGADQFHARLDLPDPHEVVAAAEVLLDPCRRHGIERVAFVAFSDDPRASARLSATLQERFEAEGITVVEVLHADGRQWRHQRAGGSPEPHPYDIGCHPFVVARIVEGEVPGGTRKDLEASVATDPAKAEAVAAAMAADPVGRPPADQAWTLRRVTRGEPPSQAADLARMLRSLTSIRCRDLAWMHVDRDNAGAYVSFWTPVVRAAPPGAVAPAASLLAFCAWLSGNGALAWCAVERALADDAQYAMAGLVAQVLERAISPRQWPLVVDSGSGRTPA